MSNVITVVRTIKLLCLCLGVAFATNAANKPLEEALNGKYEVTKTGIDRFRITKPGTVLVIQKDGIFANPSTDFGTQTTRVTDGNVIEPKGFSGAFFASKTDRSLKAGEKVYVTRIQVTNKDIRFEIMTADTREVNVNGNTRETRYAATVAFDFSAADLESANIDTIKKVIDAVLIPEGEVAAASTKTVQLGQTPDEVKAILGAPVNIVKLGPKEMYIYKDLKVIFVDGKVSDVQ
jgi:hypothetical protein